MKDKEKAIWIFLSHSHQDYDKVRKVRDILENQNLRPLMFFLKCLDDDNEITELIKREIDARTRFIYCKSVNSESSNWVQKELKYMRDNNRHYDTIDMSLSDEVLSEQLRNYADGLDVFISCKRQYSGISDSVARILNKYDLYAGGNEMIDYNTGADFRKVYMQQMPIMVDRAGCFVVLLDGSMSVFMEKELLSIAETNMKWRKIIVFLLNHEAYESYSSFTDRFGGSLYDNNFYHWNLSDSHDLVNDIADRILYTNFYANDMLAYAVDFQKGRNREKDTEEQKRAFRIYFGEAKRAFDTTHVNAAVSIARAFANGTGTDVNLEEAFHWYCEFIAEAYEEYDLSILDEARDVQQKLDERDGGEEWKKRLDTYIRTYVE